MGISKTEGRPTGAEQAQKLIEKANEGLEPNQQIDPQGAVAKELLRQAADGHLSAQDLERLAQKMVAKESDDLFTVSTAESRLSTTLLQAPEPPAGAKARAHELTVANDKEGKARRPLYSVASPREEREVRFTAHPDFQKLGLELTNVRTFAGLKTADGHTLRGGLYRGEELARRVSDAAVEGVAGAGLIPPQTRDALQDENDDAILARLLTSHTGGSGGAIIDLRGKFESESRPDGVATLEPRPAEFPQPIYDPNDDFNQKMEEVLSKPDKTDLRALVGGTKGRDQMLSSYRQFVDRREARESFGGAFRTLAQHDGPVLFHCTSGKDRTGFQAALTLLALGVSKEDVYRDYLRSQDTLAGRTSAIVQGQVASSGGQLSLDEAQALLNPVLGVDQAYLDAALARVQEKFPAESLHDSVKQFLTAPLDQGGLGVSSQELETIRHRYRD